MIGAVPREFCGPNLPEVGIDPDDISGTAPRRDRQDPVSPVELSELVGNLIMVVNRMGQFDAGRSHIPYRDSYAAGDLALDVEIPLHLVAARRIGLNPRCLQGSRAEQVECGAGEKGDNCGPVPSSVPSL